MFNNIKINIKMHYGENLLLILAHFVWTKENSAQIRFTGNNIEEETVLSVCSDAFQIRAGDISLNSSGPTISKFLFLYPGRSDTL